MLTPEGLRRRSALLQAVRRFFHSRGYIEADTPFLLRVPLPEAHITPVAAGSRFLHASPEQGMKILLAQGCERLFQVCHCFRAGEVGRLHAEEFTMLEWYRRGWSYRELMDECREFVCSLAGGVADLAGVEGGTDVIRQGRRISLAGPWDRIAVDRAFREFAGMPARQALEEERFDELLVTRVEPRLGWERPVFLYDYPAELASLARRREDDPSLAERFELYIAGVELANGFSELTDPEEQRRRFTEELEKSRQTGSGYNGLPEKFLAGLAGLDEAAGIALGLDRLFMLLTGCEKVEEVMCLAEQDL